MCKQFDITINNKLVKVNSSYNVLQACNSVNIDIPKFCYHEKLSIAGNCRMCLVEIKGIMKPIASCALPINNNMVIFTNSNLVKKAREGILEFILLNHPLDCPICDQGGECDLQDQALIYGSDRGRFYEYKRSVNDKNCGSLVKTVMTRCIHCTRCVRFVDEFIGNKYLGLIGRGSSIEISNFLSKSILSEVSGNLIDLCPVGALTSKPYSFVARPWELININSIDLNDVMHMNVRVDIRDSKVLRILPIFNSIIKENWITDLTRFSYDGYNNQRLLTPFEKINNNFISKSWLNILYKIKNKLSNKRINFFLGNYIDCESSLLLKKLSNTYGNYSINTLGINNINNNFRNKYLFNYDILNNIEDYNNILLIGLNLRIENPLLYLKLKNLQRKNILKLFNIGLNYNYSLNLNNSMIELKKLLEGRSYLCNILQKGKALVLINYNLNYQNLNFYLSKYLSNFYFMNINNSTTKIISNEFNLDNCINNFNDITYINTIKNFINNINYFINTDNILYNNMNNFSIYQGQYLNDINSLKYFDILLPSVNYLEKNSNYINFFGYVQNINFVIFPPKKARTDWKIIYIIFKLTFNTNKKGFIKLNKVNFIKLFFNTFNFTINKNKILEVSYNLNDNYLMKFNIINKLYNEKLTNLYKVNQISKSSLIMNKCFKEYKNSYINFI